MNEASPTFSPCSHFVHNHEQSKRMADSVGIPGYVQRHHEGSGAGATARPKEARDALLRVQPLGECACSPSLPKYLALHSIMCCRQPRLFFPFQVLCLGLRYVNTSGRDILTSPTRFLSRVPLAIKCPFCPRSGRWNSYREA